MGVVIVFAPCPIFALGFIGGVAFTDDEVYRHLKEWFQAWMKERGFKKGVK